MHGRTKTRTARNHPNKGKKKEDLGRRRLPDIALTFKLALENDGGFDVDTFYQPYLALTSFEAGVYDIVLLHINMPILNGFQLYTELRKIDGKVKICFITVSVDVDSSNLCIEISQSVNAECFIQKPIERLELVRRIKAKQTT